MPICPQCRTGFHITEKVCPKCGLAAPPPELNMAPSSLICSPFSYRCMWIARLGFLVGCAVSLLVALTEMVNVFRSHPAPFLGLELRTFSVGPLESGSGFSFWRFALALVGAAMEWGLFVALGFVIRNSRRSG